MLKPANEIRFFFVQLKVKRNSIIFTWN